MCLAAPAMPLLVTDHCRVSPALLRQSPLFSPRSGVPLLITRDLPLPLLVTSVTRHSLQCER
jgi:hypothetical protein